MAWTITEQPAAEPVSLQELREQCKVYHHLEDALIKSMGIAARVRCENRVDMQLVTATWLLALDRFPEDEIEFPRPPFQSLASATYVDANGNAQPLDETMYQLDAVSKPARIAPAYGKPWPVARCQMNAVQFSFVCGYGLPSAVPETIKSAIRLYTATMFEARDIDVPLPRAIEDLLNLTWRSPLAYRGHNGPRHHRNHFFQPWEHC